MSVMSILAMMLPRLLPLLGVVAVGGGVAGTVVLMRTEPVADAAVRVPATPAPAPVAGPSFDVVRVGPSGSTVIAGRAEPGATVTILDQGRDGTAALGETRADARGEWVLVPAAPLPAGARELTLAARGADGTVMPGAGSVLLSVPAAQASAAPVAVMVPAVGAPRVLGAAAPSTRLGLDAVDYDDKGGIRFAGTAAPGAPVRVYVDNKPAGDAVADVRGQWALSPPGAVAGGVHRLRVDQLAAGGRVLARVELPFERSTLPASELAGGRVVVQPGQTLWRLARGAYGSGARYTVIYLANREQIRDPKLIYPGQAFAVP